MNFKNGLFFISIFFIFSSAHSQNYNLINTDSIWNKTAKIYLQDSLWNDSLKYDASDFLMVLMHDAFTNNRIERIKDFDMHFSHIVEHPQYLKGKNRLADLQYLYFFSRYMVLKSKYKKDSNELIKCYNIIFNFIELYWCSYPYKIYKNKVIKSSIVFEGLKQRLAWKLNDSVYPQVIASKAIIDEELFYFAIVADLYSVSHILNKDAESLILEVENIAYKVFQKRVAYNKDSTWFFGSGYRDNGSDYQYIGYNSKKNVGEPKPLKEVNRDISHFRRFPLWLFSMSTGYKKHKNYYLDLYDSLNNMFFKYMYVAVSGKREYPLLNNFVDGRNGLYRYGYKTLAKGDGYGPNELSYALLGGWYSFIETQGIKSVYNDLCANYPFNGEASIYFTDKSKRLRHTIIEKQLMNEFGLLILYSSTFQLL